MKNHVKKRYLVTGGNGFIGSHLLDLLLKEGIPAQNIRLLILPGTPMDNVPNKNFPIVYGDIRNKKAVFEATRNVDVVFHLAAISGFGGKTYQDYKEVNVDGTQNLLSAVKGDVQKFIFYSTIAVFGLPPWVGNILNWDENHPKTFSEIYGRSKYEAEKRVLLWHKKYNHPYAIIRPTSVYGPRDKGQLFGMYKAIKNNTFFMIGDGKNKMDFVYVEDLVKGTYNIQANPRCIGDYILGAKKPTEFRDVAKFVALSIHKNPPSIRIPTSVGLGLSHAAEAVGKLTGVKSPLFPSRVKVMTSSYYYDISKAKSETDYNPSTSFRVGAMKTGKWYLKNKII